MASGVLESWQDPEKWTDAWMPLPKKQGPHPEFELDLNSYVPTNEDITRFHEKGYWLGPKVIGDDTLKLLNEEIKRVFEGEIDFPCGPYEYFYWLKTVKSHANNEPAVRKINNAWYVNAVFKKLSTNSSIGKMAAKLLGTEEIRLWHDQVIWKPSEAKDAKGAGNIGWHQDYGYWQCCNTSNMITAWIPLQDVSLENGAMRTIVGSHKWGLVKDSATFFDKDMDALKEKFAKLSTGPNRDWVDEPCEMKAGHIVFHHALTFHGSGPNLSDKPRLAYAMHMMPKGTAYAPGHAWHSGVKDLGPNASAGTLFEGDNFPIVHRNRRPSHMDYP